MFFDSRGWLDSDCEDDFMSVDGGTFFRFFFVNLDLINNNEFTIFDLIYCRFYAVARSNTGASQILRPNY